MIHEARVHPTAIVEEDVTLGPGTAVWDNVHIRRGARLGAQCIVGGKSHISYGVKIGQRVKINSFVFICTGVTIEDGVMISAGTMFTNDRTPRATTPNLAELRTSDPDEHTRQTLVREGATIGAHCVIGCDITIGRFAMVGMGAVVTRSVPDFHLVVGHPAQFAGYVCRCGNILLRYSHTTASGNGHTARQHITSCGACGLAYSIDAGRVCELTPPLSAVAR